MIDKPISGRPQWIHIWAKLYGLQVILKQGLETCASLGVEQSLPQWQGVLHLLAADEIPLNRTDGVHLLTAAATQYSVR
jgi:hypothetical protein